MIFETNFLIWYWVLPLTNKSKNMLIKTNAIVRKAIKNFKGPLLKEIPDGAKFANEKMVGEMNKEEKILFTIHSKMKSECEKVAIKLCGKRIDDMSPSELNACNTKISQNATEKQKARLSAITEEGNLLYEALFESIGERLIKGTSYNSVVIRQGWKIYAGNRKSSRGSGGPMITFKAEGDRIVFM